MGNEQSSQPAGLGDDDDDDDDERSRRQRLSLNGRKMMSDGHDTPPRSARSSNDERPSRLAVGYSSGGAGGVAGGGDDGKTILKEGWLSKKGKINKGWRRRYFRLTSQTLSYYNTPDRYDCRGRGRRGGAGWCVCVCV